jgi:hypothetical protein
VGSEGSGKSSLIRCLRDDSFTESYIRTLGKEIIPRSLNVGGRNIILQLKEVSREKGSQLGIGMIDKPVVACFPCEKVPPKQTRDPEDNKNNAIEEGDGNKIVEK